MTQKRQSSSLLSPQARGGDIAEGGFQYQLNSTKDKGEINLTQKRQSSSLLSPQARGGDIAEGGFQYQLNSMRQCSDSQLACSRRIHRDNSRSSR